MHICCVFTVFNLIPGCAARPPLMFCCIIFELIIWNPTQLVNSPVFFFRCPLCSRWIGYCISALLGCVCEWKAAVLYHMKSITLQLVCTCLPAPVCAYTVGVFYALVAPYESIVLLGGWRMKPCGSVTMCLNVFDCHSPFPSYLSVNSRSNHFLEMLFKTDDVKEKGVDLTNIIFAWSLKLTL